MINLESYAYEMLQEIEVREDNYWYRSVYENEFSLEDRDRIVDILYEECYARNLFFGWRGVTSEYFCFYTKPLEESEIKGYYENGSESESESEDEDNLDNNENQENIPEVRRVWTVLPNGYGFGNI